ncbi:MAG: hypothetical protein LQ340_001078 [Diploschistes diacapsis]|nr:MAG: hypothetical protein LQ340_001078 [Diploschistes diacapsis]
MSAFTNARPKRGGEEFSRNHYHSDVSSSKKPRFDTRNPAALVPDAPEEDEVLDADEIGKRGQQTKRNAVNIDGYESDSSNEGFDRRAELKTTQETGDNIGADSKHEEDDDMFADLEDDYADKDKDDGKGGKRKKSVKFLDVRDIEGQVQDSRSGGHVSADFSQGQGGEMDEEADSTSDSEVGDEERARVGSDMDEELGAGSKKKHAPKLDAFHLRAEQEDGGFDEHGNYVRKAQDPDAVYDTWMEGVSKKDLKKAREAQARRENQQRQKRLEDDSVTTGEVLKTLISHLDKGETILEALARLGRNQTKKPVKRQSRNKNRRSHQMDVDPDMRVEDPTAAKRREAVIAITGAADILLIRNNSEVYEADRELLIRMYGRETREEWVEDTADVVEKEPRQWEYRWSDARDGGEAHGPYDSVTMQQWSDAGYFGEDVEFRRAEDVLANWERSVEF